ncbi:hypothetical protein D7Y27_20540 [Corallococcus sp. AB004]|uniref:hypothetical protein n=1 Tax=Corallococcus sp. AB038B TaxID=2316718 RepID=UPI000EA37B90|nr:hypothetical protein [Corallococcus sp. AB038B]RKI40352.1 hypothetical protein D7Y27_20540 [Corallococcus sp. AB004]
MPDTAPSPTDTPILAKPTAAKDFAASGSVMLGPNGISGSASLEAGVKVDAGIFSMKVAGYTEVGASFSRDAEMTTFSVDAEVGVKGELQADTPNVTVTGTAQAGVRGSYQVTLPTAAAAGITSPEQAAQQLNPSLPQNLPVGATVTLNGEAFVGTGMEVVFKNISGIFGAIGGMSTEKASGMSLAVTRLDDKTVRVTAGPTEAVSRTLEGKLGVFDIAFGATDTRRVEGQLSSRQVDFDISTPAGQAAYNQFLATGELPKNDPANGTSNAATVQIASDTLTREVTFAIDLGAAVIDSNVYVATTYDAGGPTEFQYTGTKGPVTFSVSGEWKDPEDPSTYTYAATLPDLASGSANGLQDAFANTTGTGTTASVSFTHAEAQQVQQLAKDWLTAIEQGQPGYAGNTPESWVVDVANAATPEEAMALLLTPETNNFTDVVAERMSKLSAFQFNHGGGQLPGSLTLSEG